MLDSNQIPGHSILGYFYSADNLLGEPSSSGRIKRYDSYSDYDYMPYSRYFRSDYYDWTDDESWERPGYNHRRHFKSSRPSRHHRYDDDVEIFDSVGSRTSTNDNDGKYIRDLSILPERHDIFLPRNSNYYSN